jgi:hypothetical protein
VARGILQRDQCEQLERLGERNLPELAKIKNRDYWRYALEREGAIRRTARAAIPALGACGSLRAPSGLVQQDRRVG